MLEDINKSFKKYSIPMCPLWVILFSPFIITWTMGFFFGIMYPAQMIATFALHFIAIISLGIISRILIRKRIKAVQYIIENFNKTMAFRGIWAEWNSDYHRIGQRNAHPKPELFIKKKLCCDCYHIQIDSAQSSDLMVAPPYHIQFNSEQSSDEMVAPPSYQDIFGSK